MRIIGEIPTTILLLFFLFIAPSTADIKSVKIQSHNRDIILFSKFKYSNSGYVSVAVSSVGISTIPVTSNSSQPDHSRIGFFLLSNELEHRYNLEFNRNPDLCALDIKFITILLTFQNLSPPPQSSFNKSYNVTFPGEYSLYFVNCNDLSLVTMDVRTELYNNNDGITKNYLSADQPQPSLTFFFIYLCFLGFWINVCFLKKQYFEWLHLVMGVLLVITLLHLYCADADQQHLKITGTHHLRWQVLFYIFQFLRNVVLYTVIMLIGVGWCIWRRTLPWWMIFNWLIVIVLQVWCHVSYTVVGESLLYNEEFNLKESVVFIKIGCGIVVFLHTFCSGIAFEDAKDTSTFVRSYISVKGTSANPDVFIWLLLAYLILLSWHKPGNLVFYMVMFYMFRPFDLDNEEKCAGIFHDSGDKV